VYDPPTAAVFLLQSFREWSGAGKPAPPLPLKAVPAGMYWVRKTPLQEA